MLRVITEEDSPCVGLCQIGDDGRCIGCGRTESEIAGETENADETKPATVDNLP